MSITQRVFNSSMFQITFNLIQRFIGIISMLILARVLTPADFGVIAVLMLTIHLVDILSDAGSQQYIIQKQDSDDKDLNTAWTLDILSKLALTCIIWIAAPTISDFLSNPLLTDAIRIISLSIPLRALKNPQMILLAKELNYQKLFKLNLSQKLLSFVVVMIIVVIDQSFWAIILGEISASVILLVGSYHTLDYRPKLTLERLRQQWSFSQWALLRGTTGYIRSQADMLIASKIFTPAAIGAYHLQRELALIPALSLIIPGSEPLMTAIAKAKSDNELLKYRIRKSIQALLSFLIPCSILMAFESQNIVRVLLGEQWLPDHELLAAFSMMFFAFCLHALLSDCFAATNRLKQLFFFDLVSTCFIAAGLFLAIGATNTEFALYRAVMGLAVTFSLLLALQLELNYNLKQLAANCIPIVISSLVGLFSLTMLTTDDNNQTFLPSLASLILESSAFFIIVITTYSLVSTITRNQLAENFELFEQAAALLRAIRNRISSRHTNS